MTKKTVKLTVVHKENDWRPWQDVEIKVNNQVIAMGHVGGEPEDNTIWRDYDWIVPAFKAVVEELGGDFTMIEIEELESD